MYKYIYILGVPGRVSRVEAYIAEDKDDLNTVSVRTEDFVVCGTKLYVYNGQISKLLCMGDYKKDWVYCEEATFITLFSNAEKEGTIFANIPHYDGYLYRTNMARDISISFFDKVYKKSKVIHLYINDFKYQDKIAWLRKLMTDTKLNLHIYVYENKQAMWRECTIEDFR